MTRILKEILEQIIVSAEKCYPNECCGLLIGTPGFIKEMRATANVSGESQRRRYVISPLDLLAAENYARSAGMEVLGVYHSHPDHPAKPSRYDRDHAVPHYLSLIVGVRKGRAGTASCWIMPGLDSEYVSEELVVIGARSH